MSTFPVASHFCMRELSPSVARSNLSPTLFNTAISIVVAAFSSFSFFHFPCGPFCRGGIASGVAHAVSLPSPIGGSMRWHLSPWPLLLADCCELLAFLLEDLSRGNDLALLRETCGTRCLCLPSCVILGVSPSQRL